MKVQSYIGRIRRTDGKRFPITGRFTIDSSRFESILHAKAWAEVSAGAFGQDYEVITEVVLSGRKPEIMASEVIGPQ